MRKDVPFKYLKDEYCEQSVSINYKYITLLYGRIDSSVKSWIK